MPTAATPSNFPTSPLYPRSCTPESASQAPPQQNSTFGGALQRRRIVFLTEVGWCSPLGDQRPEALAESWLLETPREEVLTWETYLGDPKLFWQGIREAFYVHPTEPLPSAFHLWLPTLEKQAEIPIITTRVDSLHRQAGSALVVELYGSMNYVSCPPAAGGCGAVYKASDYYRTEIPQCHLCHTYLKPYVVFPGEGSPSLEQAKALATEAEKLVIVGVHPESILWEVVAAHQWLSPQSPRILVGEKPPVGQWRFQEEYSCSPGEFIASQRIIS